SGHTPLDGRDDLLELDGLLDDLAARTREDKTLWRMCEEPRVERFLQRGEASTHGRVFHSQIPRRAGQRARAVHRQEVAEIVPVQHTCRFAQTPCTFRVSRARGTPVMVFLCPATTAGPHKSSRSAKRTVANKKERQPW